MDKINISSNMKKKWYFSEILYIHSFVLTCSMLLKSSEVETAEFPNVWGEYNYTNTIIIIILL